MWLTQRMIVDREYDHAFVSLHQAEEFADGGSSHVKASSTDRSQ